MVPVQKDPHANDKCAVDKPLFDGFRRSQFSIGIPILRSLEPGMSTYASQAASCLHAKYTFATEPKAPTSPKIMVASVSRVKDHESSKLLAIVTLSWSVWCSVLAANLRVSAGLVRFVGSCGNNLVAILNSRLGIQYDFLRA